MKFFEVTEPYYALLKGENEEDVLLQYNAAVAYLEDIKEIKEVSEDYALVKFSQTPDVNKELIPPLEVLEDFKDPNIYLLVLDGALL